MPAFPKPKFEYEVDLAKEIRSLSSYRDNERGRKIPSPTANTLRLATWNIANLGAQERETSHLKLIAELISWFDLIAIQEIKENSLQFQEITTYLKSSYRFVFSDEGGNNERMAFVYNTKKVQLLHEVAELAIPPAEFRHITLPGNTGEFNGFDRSPYMASFRAADFNFTLLNVHLYFGDESETASINRRCLEAYAIGRWADLRGKSKSAYVCNIFAIGDFNLPKVDVSDAVYQALMKRGLQLPEHSSKIYSNILNDKAYDQITFLPGLKSRVLSHGVFDFDGVVFKDIYEQKTAAEFRGYLRYYLSDHRPMWMEIDVTERN